MRRGIAALLLLSVACADHAEGGGPEAASEVAAPEAAEPASLAPEAIPSSTPPAEAADDEADDEADGETVDEAVADSPFPPDIRSVRLRRSISVRVAPGTDAKKYGTIAAHTRAAFVRAATGPGCEKRWIEIRPMGWICEDYLDPSKKRPHGVELPRLDTGELIPGSYGKVIAEGTQVFTVEDGELVPARELAGSVHVRNYGELVRQEGEPPEPVVYWNIGHKEYVPVDSLRLHEPSRFAGARLSDDTGIELPIIFARDRKRLDRKVPSTRSPTGGKRVRRLPGRSLWPVREVARDDAGEPIAYRIGDGEWVAASRAIYVEAAEPPPRTLPGEKWIDVDLDRQVLVAYEGTLPVYATLISSGSRKWPTETGVYRIWIKFAETGMSGQMADEAPYSVATVPWTQFYSKDLALHTSYWHDGFATRRSHGCVNLAPIDSRFLYFWSEPEVPPGWSMAHGTTVRPGSIVRVRSKADPDPPFRGLAKEIYDARADS